MYIRKFKFRFSTKRVNVAYAFAFFFAILVGVAIPATIIIYRSFINDVYTDEAKLVEIYPLLISFAVLGFVVYFLAFIQSYLFNYAAQVQIRIIKEQYFKALLRQDSAWYDRNSTGTLINYLSANMEQINQGLGTKLGEVVMNVSAFVSGIIIALSFGWKLSLPAIALLPIITGVFTAFGIAMKKFTFMQLEAYGEAGKVVTGALSAIKTVITFSGEETEVDRYTKHLGTAEKVGIKKAAIEGLVIGMISLVVFSSSAILFAFGIELLITDAYNPGTVVLVVINIIMGSFYLGYAMPSIPYITHAMSAAKNVFGIINRVPDIDKNMPGTIIPEINGNISLQDVSFTYPTRPEVKILNSINLEVKNGEILALIGPSGSGKSTIIELLLRFYDTTEGKIKIEGHDVRELDLKNYRSKVGYVQQEPILFDGTVLENIRMGKPDATMEEIEEAARTANAHGFIATLPEGYDTWLGERGAGLSGGQKQRIAIARALVKKPKLLLLDEATSALDSKAEKVVQRALDAAAVGRTVIVVAHRLTTIRNATRIVVLDGGNIREHGTHSELLARRGLYATMLYNQRRSAVMEIEGEDELSEESDDNNNQDITPSSSNSAPIDESAILSEKGVYLTSQVSVWSEAITVQQKKLKSLYSTRIFKMSGPEKWYMLAGCLFSVLAGIGQPLFALLYAEVYDLFDDIDEQDFIRARIRIISIEMFILGLSRLVGEFGQGYFFGVTGERLVTRVRRSLLESMLRQEMGWFDQPEHQCGILTTLLATDAANIKSISGSQLGNILQAAVLVLVSLIISFISSWRLALLFLVFFPLLIVSGMLSKRNLSGADDRKEETGGISVAQQAISAHKTVFTLCLEDNVWNRFSESLKFNKKKQRSAALSYAGVYALSQAINLWSAAVTFALGVHLVEVEHIEITDIFRVFIVMTMTSQAIGRTISFGPELKDAADSAKTILQILDRKSKIPKDKGQVPEQPFMGNIEFRNVYFRYPTRRDVRVLKNFSHKVEPGETVALVGQSGCGKTTVLQLVQRLYDPSNRGPNSGIFFDQHNIRYLAPSWVRKQLAIVSQEPNLFDLSIRENIAYGDNSRHVLMQDIIQAARTANIHDFIASLPDGYETNTGEGGSQLSGGQKQRIAIARALVKRPKLLILDEATSALDIESQMVVQQALDAAVGSRTSLVVAHMLSAVQNSDTIVVLEDGRCIESGSPSVLMEARGAFWALHRAQDNRQ